MTRSAQAAHSGQREKPPGNDDGRSSAGKTSIAHRCATYSISWHCHAPSFFVHWHVFARLNVEITGGHLLEVKRVEPSLVSRSFPSSGALITWFVNVLKPLPPRVEGWRMLMGKNAYATRLCLSAQTYSF